MTQRQVTSALGPHQVVYMVASQMIAAGLPPRFVEKAVQTALVNGGVADLFMLWAEENEQDEKNQIIADIESTVADYDQPAQTIKTKIPNIDFDKLYDEGLSVVQFKKSLRAIVDANGGVSELSLRTGMTTQSLYRFFDSAATPRKTTLFKIAEAFSLRKEDVFFK